MNDIHESPSNRRSRTGSSRISVAIFLGALGLALVAGCGGGGRPSAEVDTTRPEEISFDKDPGVWRARVAETRRKATLDPQEPYWSYELGVLHAGVDSLETSEQHLLRALALDPGYAPALTRLTGMYFATGRHAEAVEILETARAFYGDGSEDGERFPAVLLAALGLHYEALGELEKVREVRGELEQASAAPSSVTPYLYLRSEDFRHARQPAERALVESPGSAANYNNYGITRLHTGNPVEARKAFLTANEIDPLLPGPLYNLALVERFYFMNDEKAKEWFDRYWDLSQKDPDHLRTEFYGDETQP